MALKDEWKKTGKYMSCAFRDLGKNVVRSVKAGADEINSAFNGSVPPATPEEKNVFNDGSWRTTGKEWENALASLGKSMIKSAKVGIDRLDELVESNDEKFPPSAEDHDPQASVGKEK